MKPKDIAAAINADRRALQSNYRPVKSTEVANWLATGGLESRIRKWLEKNIVHNNHEVYESAFNGLKAIRSNADATLRVGPEDAHRQLLIDAVSDKVIKQSDFDAVDSIAYHGRDETAETVQESIDRQNSPSMQWTRFVDAGAAHQLQHADATLAEIVAAASQAMGL